MFHRSERLLLRPAFLEDATELAAAIGQKAIVRNLARVPWPYTEDDARAWLDMPRDERLPSLLITLPAENAMIVGGCGLHEGENGPELGYWVAPEHWGRGIATEAARGLLQAARVMGHSRIMARHASDNPASGQVLRKLGFLPTGRSATFFSLGRNAHASAPEYAIDLAESDMSGVAKAA